MSTDGSHWNTAPVPTTAPITNLAADTTGFLVLTDSEAGPGPVPAEVPGQPAANITTLLRSTDAAALDDRRHAAGTRPAGDSR